MKITRELIHSGRVAGWNKLQFDILGEPWPPTKGWIERACKKEISESDADSFVRLSGGRRRRALANENQLSLF